MRACPRCHVPLAPAFATNALGGKFAAFTGDVVQVDACPTCAGSFLERGEAGLLTGNVGLDTFLAPPRTRHVDGARCPRCSETMAFREVAGVVLDACPGCGGFWLDRGELTRLRKALQQPSD